ncbi:MAG: hypothetical protein K9M03_04390 [Kiritimatiellales bacterium]|nr:hypothetical protein [Kiritimatiellales bacterium]
MSIGLDGDQESSGSRPEDSGDRYRVTYRMFQCEIVVSNVDNLVEEARKQLLETCPALAFIREIPADQIKTERIYG